MKLYVARHGQTTWNVANKVCGRTDVPLTEKGQQQAKELAQAAKDCGIDVIISSPLQRAYRTALAVSEATGVPVRTDERLLEQNYGIYEGVDRDDPDFNANKRQFASPYPQGESMFQLCHRLYGLLDEVKEQYAGKTVLLVCHNGVCRVIHTYFHPISNEDFAKFKAPNAKLVEYGLEG